MADDDLLPDEEGKDKKKISKTTWLYLGLAAGALVLTYLIYEHSKGSSSGSNSNSNPMGGTPINPEAEIAVPTAASTYQPGTEMQAYQQGIQDALSIVQAQQGTGAEGSSTTTPSSSSGSGTSSQTLPATTTPATTITPTTTITAPDPEEPATPVLSQYGGGFAPTNISDRTYPYQIGGVPYHWISNPAEAQRDISAGEQLYYSPSPGEMVPVTGSLPTGTPEYVRQ